MEEMIKGFDKINTQSPEYDEIASRILEILKYFKASKTLIDTSEDIFKKIKQEESTFKLNDFLDRLSTKEIIYKIKKENNENTKAYGKIQEAIFGFRSNSTSSFTKPPSPPKMTATEPDSAVTEDYKKQSDEITKQITKLQNEISEKEMKQTAIKDILIKLHRIRRTQKHPTETNKKIKTNQEELNVISAEIDKKKKDILALETKLKDLQHNFLKSRK